MPTLSGAPEVTFTVASAVAAGSPLAVEALHASTLAADLPLAVDALQASALAADSPLTVEALQAVDQPSLPIEWIAPSPDGTILTAPSSGSLRTAAGVWTFSNQTAAPNWPNDYIILLNGVAPPGFGSAVEMEVANGGQLYTYDGPGGNWWIWNGSGWSQSAAP